MENESHLKLKYTYVSRAENFRMVDIGIKA